MHSDLYMYLMAIKLQYFSPNISLTVSFDETVLNMLRATYFQVSKRAHKPSLKANIVATCAVECGTQFILLLACLSSEWI